MSKLDRLVWAASSTYRIGQLHIGVRTDSEWLDGVVAAALADYLVPGLDAPPNFSLVIPRAEADRSAKGLNMLYEGHTNLVRSRYPTRVLRALFQHLAKYLPAPSDELLRVSSLALIRNGEAILVPRSITTWMDQLAPRLNRAGWQFVDHPWSKLDLESAELVVDAPALNIADGWQAELDSRTTRREPEAVGAGRFPLVGWGVFSAEERVMSRAAGAAAAAPTVLNPSEYGVHAVIDDLLTFTEHTPLTGLGSPFEGDFATRVIELAPTAA